MGASFRNIGQITNLAGCDLLTISPELLAELQGSESNLNPALSPEKAKASGATEIAADEKSFRYQLNQDAMATEKLSEGIRLFCADIEKLEKLLLA
jgi:transaldolase